MGNHYANEAGLNHTVPMIICWEEPRLLGSLVCSTAGTHFFGVLSYWFLTLLFFSYTAIFSLILCSVSSCVYVVLDLGCILLAQTRSVHGFYMANSSLAIYFQDTQHTYSTLLSKNIFYHNKGLQLLDQYDLKKGICEESGLEKIPQREVSSGP